MLGNSLIKHYVQTQELISPFVSKKVSNLDTGEPILSYGLVEAGYDIRLDRVFTVKKDKKHGYIDPKDPTSGVKGEVIMRYENGVDDIEQGAIWFLAQPKQTYLGTSLEHINMPPNVKAIVFPKSTYARCHVICHVTPLEPGWHGYITIEFVNLGDYPVKVYINEGFASILFFDVGEELNYQGIYQGQGAQVYLAGEKVLDDEF